MEQMSFFTENQQFPTTYDEVETLFMKCVHEGEKDDDFFIWGKEKVKGNGKSGYLYGKKILEFVPLSDSKKASLKVFLLADNAVSFTSQSSMDDLIRTLQALKADKKTIFRNLVVETFGCCNSFKECSAVDHCIHEDDRFYNGCMYRKNLEAGRNFYKESTIKQSENRFTNVVGLDFETANSGRSSACSVAAVKLDLAGKEIDQYSSLINPHEDFDFFNIMVHGIRPEMVEGAPDIDIAMSNVFKMIEPDSLVVCHNAAFDMSVLVHSLEKKPIAIPDFYYTCTYRLASRVLPKDCSYSLPFVALHCGITEFDHHEAYSDAKTCAAILLYMVNMFDGDFDKLHQTANIRFGHFKDGEYEGIHKIARESDPSRKRTTKKLPDHTIGPESPFYGKTVAFTGELGSMSREEALALIESIGGTGTKTVNKKTDYLVTGYQDPSRLAEGKNKSSKVLRAEELSAEGYPIEIIPEDLFLQML